MSQYRDHRDAARHRIEALEIKLAEREAALALQGAELAERDAEIVRLRRALERAGTTVVPGRAKPVADAWMGRVVGAAVGLSALTAILGALVMHKAPAPVVASNGPSFADPPPVTLTPIAPPEGAAPAEGADAPRYERAPDLPDETQLRRRLEPRVWSGRASLDEVKMLKAICSHQGDHACRNRAAAEIARRTAQDDHMGL
jgi:hypothetical protein